MSLIFEWSWVTLIEWLSEIFNDTKHRAVSLRQLSFLQDYKYIFIRQTVATTNKKQKENKRWQMNSRFTKYTASRDWSLLLLLVCVSWAMVSHETASSSAECSRDKLPFRVLSGDRKTVYQWHLKSETEWTLPPPRTLRKLYLYQFRHNARTTCKYRYHLSQFFL